MKNREAITYTIVPGDPDDKNFDINSEFNIPFRMHTHASNGVELDFQLCHSLRHVGMGPSNSYIVQGEEAVAKVFFEPGDHSTLKVQFANVELFNMDDMDIAMLKCAEGMAQQVQHLPTRKG